MNEMFKMAQKYVNDGLKLADKIGFDLMISVCGMLVDYTCAKFGEDNIKTMERLCEVQKQVQAECGAVEV